MSDHIDQYWDRLAAQSETEAVEVIERALQIGAITSDEAEWMTTVVRCGARGE